MRCPYCKKNFKDYGRVKGGSRSKRKITEMQQAKMQLARRKNALRRAARQAEDRQ